MKFCDGDDIGLPRADDDVVGIEARIAGATSPFPVASAKVGLPSVDDFRTLSGWTAVDPKQPLVDACAFDASCPIPVIAYSRSRGLLGQGRSPRYLVPAQRPPGDAPNVPHRSVTS